MITELDRAFDMTFNCEVFAAVQLTLDDDRLPYVHDVLLHELTRLCWTRCGRSRRGWRGRLRRSRRLSARRSNRFIAFPHVFLRLSSSRALGCLPSYLSGASSGHYSCSEKCCLVLLNPMVSGSARMKGSRCVSTLTTTRRPRWRPM